MNPILFVCSIAGGIALCGVGSGVQFGTGVGLMVAGAMVVAATFGTAVLAAWSGA